MLTLLQHPDQLSELKADPSLSKAVVDELMRFHTASGLNGRRAAKEALTIGGKVCMNFPQWWCCASAYSCGTVPLRR